MPDFQQRHAPDPSREAPLRGDSRVTGEEQARAAEGDEQHDRFLVDVRLAYGPGGVRTHHLDRPAVHVHPIAAASGAPLRAITLDRAEEPEISRIWYRLAGFEHVRRVERVEHRRQATEVIAMRVRGNNCRQLRRPVAPEKRHDDAPAGIPLRSPGPTIDQHPPPRRTAQRNCVALADVKETYGQALT